MLPRWIARQGWGLWIGIGLTLLTVTLHLVGFTERIELLGFDYHVRHFSRIPASDRIVHIDIDDDALARVESWPWPRDMQGELIRILHELGADRIVMDIVWSEPKGAEVRLPSLGRYADIEGDVEQIGELSPENIVYPDDELAQAIAEAKQVYLSMYYEESARTDTISPLAVRIAELLRKDFGLSAIAIHDQLGVEAKSVEDIIPSVKRNVAEELVHAALNANPSASAAQIHAAILKTPFDRETADRADVLAAYHRQLSLRVLREKCPPVPPGLKGKLPTMQRPIPPVYKFTAGARKAGFVTFNPDMDGRTRHIPLLLDWDGLLVEQLGFGVARDLLDIQVNDLSMDDRGNLKIAARGHRPAMRVQLDEQGQLINWHVEQRGWQDCFTHVPVTKLLEIYDCRKRIRENETRKQLAIAQAIRITKDDTAYEGYRQQVNTLLQKERAVRWAKLQGRSLENVQTAEAEIKSLRELVENDQNQTIQFITDQWAALQKESNPNDPDIAKDYKRFEEAHGLIAGNVAELMKVNEQIAAQERYALDRLRPIIQNKLCFVGYTATAVADMVTTPAYSRMPGVLVHSNLLNSFLQGQFRTWSPRWAQAAVIALLGVTISILTATRPPKLTFFLMMLIISVSVLLNAFSVFERMDHWMRLLTALLMTFIVWAIIVLFRFLTTDRQKRQFSKAVAQYVSPAVAKRIADSTTRLDLSPVNRVVTCFFSDLAGFTRMSERLGPEGTRTVLNPYLEAMSNVLHQHNALINKFMGDGIFAFFNPPILPCADHHRAACEAALDSQQALAELGNKYNGEPAGDDFKQLSMRIGIATGPVFVGDYGSENKLDYTCMGDTVNLASRLEAANKVYGSKILMAGSTHDPVAGKYISRRLGWLQVKGQTVAVPVWELVGRIGQVNGDELSFIESFSAAIEAYSHRDWQSASLAFEKCLQLRPRDSGAARYIELISGYRTTPPPHDWNCAIELTEK